LLVRKSDPEVSSAVLRKLKSLAPNTTRRTFDYASELLGAEHDEE
jgi:hypothetical protein